MKSRNLQINFHLWNAKESTVFKNKNKAYRKQEEMILIAVTSLSYVIIYKKHNAEAYNELFLIISRISKYSEYYTGGGDAWSAVQTLGYLKKKQKIH